MLARLGFVSDKQQALQRAAREFVEAEKAGASGRIDYARRGLDVAGVELGAAVKRYFGGHEK